ncbi:hypothetical protein SAMN05444920_101796 [Nonomuraea solani]|uniref:DUF1772 domain-containing protein n=1 Tax=Nonomuraea solani TaxID=1144553 RepID=A0A1H5V9G1_9ACTN|nr:hypothetical protein [Nonomuraea solani]SEF83428.1 hypothetical protein SAMN05444920_101796 [Nonomuraea solani]
MRTSEVVLLATLIVAMFNAGVIWLTQLVVYPVWALVGEAEWSAYHDAHKRRLPGTAFVPHGLALLGALLLIVLRPAYVPGWAVWLAFAVEAVMLAATATYWAPLQIRLSRGNDPRLLRRLLATHWIRAGLVTVFGALLCWMVMLALDQLGR